MQDKIKPASSTNVDIKEADNFCEYVQDLSKFSVSLMDFDKKIVAMDKTDGITVYIIP